MKQEFEIKIKEQTELSVEKLQQIERELKDVLTAKNGHKIFEINIKTLEVKEAVFDSELTFILGQENKKSITMVSDCVYIPALNKKTALEKYKKGKFKYADSNFKPIQL